MADISKITLPNGSEYNFKDAAARGGQKIYYATCTTAAGTAAKVAATTNTDFTLETGAMVRVKFTNADTYNGTSTLNVDSKGAKNIVRVGTIAKARYFWEAGEVVDFVYDGTNFVMLEGGTATTTYYGITALSSATNSTSEVLAATPKAVKAAYDLADGKQDPISAGTGISISSDTVSLESGVVTAGSAGPTAAVTGNEGTTVAIPRITVDTYGRVTGLTSYNLTNKNTTYTAATSAPGNVASSSAVGTSTNYARQDHTHGITLATGDQNGQVKIAGTNVDVKGLGDVAYTDDGSTSVTSHDVSGSVLSFTAAIPQPVKSMVLDLEPAQSGSGDPSPSNIRPITGYDAVNVVRAGKRFENTVLSGYLDTSGKYKTSSAGSKSVYALVDAGTVYINKNASSVFRVGLFDSVPVANAQSTNFVDIGATATTYELDVPSAGYLTVFVVNSSSSTDLANSDEILASVAISDSPITTYPISLSSAGTVYGGTLDVTTGELVVDRVCVTYDGSSDESWSYYSVTQGNLFRTSIPDRMTGDLVTTGFITNMFSTASQNNRTNGTVSTSAGASGVTTDYIYDDCATLEEWKTWLASNPLQACYKLATPIIYGLTPTEVTTLLGDNNIWMDAKGTIDVTYEDVVSPIKYAEVGELGTAATRNANDKVIPDDSLPTGKAVSNYTPSHAQNGIYYGTCSTAAGTAAKVIDLVDPTGFELNPGVMIAVRFMTTNTASNVTFNVEGTGAKHIWYNASVLTGSSSSTLGYANRTYFYVYDGTNWVIINKGFIDDNAYPSAQCETAAATAAKAASCTNHTLTANTYCHFNIRYSNTAKSALTMNVDSSGAKSIYINGKASSSSNYTLPAGTYIAFYNGTYWNFRTDGVMPGTNEKAESLQSSIDSINNKMPALLTNTNVTSTATTVSLTAMNNYSLFLIEYVAGTSNDVFLNSILVSLDSLKSPTGFVIQNKGIGDNLIESDSIHIKYTSGTSFSMVTTSGASNRYVRVTGLL